LENHFFFLSVSQACGAPHELTAPRVRARRCLGGCYDFRMSRAGFVLVGGRSSRMGCNKALLSYRGATLVEYIASEVQSAAGSVSLVGSADLYCRLPYPVVPDRFPNCGPAAGVHAALACGEADWNLIVACDMPGVTRDRLARLLEEAERRARQALIPLADARRPQPLCAVYHRDCLPVFERALRMGRYRLSSVIQELDLACLSPEETAWLENLNTPADWAAHVGR